MMNKKQTTSMIAVFRRIFVACLLGCLSVLTNAVMAGDLVPDPETWYAESYGALWLKEPWNSKDEILDCYADEVRSHGENGEVTAYATDAWLTGLFEEWREEGWVSSEISGLTTDRVHPGMAVIKAQWRDFYTDQDEGYSCGWYLAKFKDKRWQMTDYATIDCAQHGF